ncbi:hypothetical protein QTH89_22180 [Variovorax sp. J22G21]|uniref:hypothetical protein n=1 Tax=Variovorax fucosicus TaxID=3053517 RepID=UPI00257872BB|nr:MULTISPECIES: hypothetical protein [unclassified Variovorax]MDM0039160.1 hypothetical protein [Variovorax sp. J22R193]MDM0063936.1 hypothetical protein [Variovorax sp. J22G21]
MALQLLHQVGHNSNWNVDSLQDLGLGDGLILSPLHQNIAAVEKLKPETRATSLFDPQFYLPSSRKPKLLTYPFFPESVDGGFQTSTFKAQALAVARECVEFQIKLGFRKVVVPTRFIDQMLTDYVDRQRQFTVEAFMEAAGDRPLCLSVAITSAMIQDAGFRTRLLNWITSYPNVDEIYLMYQHPRDSKLIQDGDFLRECLHFFTQIRATGLALTVGYTNVEGLLFSTVGDLSLTIGSFENTRIFSIERFLVSEDERRGPKARIYLSGLMNWLQFEDAKTIRAKAPAVWKAVYRGTAHSEEALALPVEPTFNQAQLYKHYFENMHDEFRVLDKVSAGDRRVYLLDRLSKAKHAYEAIAGLGIQLEKHGRGGHVKAWADALS